MDSGSDLTEHDKTRTQFASIFDRLVDANLHLVTMVKRQVFAIYIWMVIQTIMFVVFAILAMNK